MADFIWSRVLWKQTRFLQQIRSMFAPSTTTEATLPTKPAATSRVSQVNKLKAFMQLPGPKGWPFLGSFPDYFKKENRGQMHELMRRRHREYGPMFREQFGPRHNVAIADPRLMEEVFRKEGKFPARPPYESWVLYNKLRRRQGGLMTADTEYWRKCRSTLAVRLRPKAANEYVGAINQVCRQLVERLSELRAPGTHQVPLLANELNKFTMETIMLVLLNKRLGCLDRPVSEEVNCFIQSIATMFLTGHQLMVYASVHRALGTRPWRRHVEAWDQIYLYAADLIQQRIDEVTSELETTTMETEEVDFMKFVVGSHQLSRAEIVENVVEIFLGGIDTTASALGFLFYLLAKHESAQERVVQEIDAVLGTREAESSDLQKLPFLKACVKETLRLYPPIPMNARTTTEDTSIGGYHIPRDTILMLNVYVMARDKTVFHDPDEFKPDRWLREEANDSHPHPFASIPFGSGRRTCVGRRIAEMQIYLLTIQVLQRFKLVKSDQFDISPSVRTQLTPGPELPVMFVDR